MKKPDAVYYFRHLGEFWYTENRVLSFCLGWLLTQKQHFDEGKKTSNFSHSIYFSVRFAPFTLHKQLSSFRYIDYTKTWNWYFPMYSWASYKNTANVLQASLGTATLCKGKASMELATKQNLPTALNLLILMYVAECTSILVSRHRWKQNCFS